jgi:hypothetical protein
MPDIDEVRALFEAVLLQDKRVLRRIEDCPGEAWLEQGKFVFSLSGLLAVIDPQGDGDAQQFRKLLYSSRLNQELRAGGAEIAIFRQCGKVKSNLYCLKTT